MTPTMTLSHLLFAVATTAYILIAIRFEESDLVRDHPEYEEYRRSVPMLMPFARRRVEAVKRLGVVGLLFFVVKGLAWLAIPAVLAMGR